jgi:phosphoglycolate phosphatase
LQNKKKILQKVRNIIFDLDGVLLDSKKNMNVSWDETRKKFKLKTTFNDYAKFVGLPFEKILFNLKIKKKLNEIKLFYKKRSRENIRYLKLYPYVKKTLTDMKKNKVPYYLVTSKDLSRTKEIINYFKLKPKSIHCPKIHLRGKPYPDQLLECIKQNNIKPNQTCYCGDTYFDYQAAKAAKLDFIFAKYGFGKDKKNYKNKLKNFNDLKKYISYLL